jgi:hypothetical protein
MYDPHSHTASPKAARYATWALALLVVGWLLAISSGLCGGLFIVSGLSDNTGYGSALAMAGLLVGGIPCAVGVAMILAARRWGRRKPTQASPDVFS